MMENNKLVFSKPLCIIYKMICDLIIENKSVEIEKELGLYYLCKERVKEDHIKNGLLELALLMVYSKFRKIDVESLKKEFEKAGEGDYFRKYLEKQISYLYEDIKNYDVFALGHGANREDESLGMVFFFNCLNIHLHHVNQCKFEDSSIYTRSMSGINGCFHFTEDGWFK